MDIEGPIKIGVLDREDGSGRELHISFRDDFSAMDVPGRDQTFRAYLLNLHEGIQALSEGDPNRAGMLIVQQICEQLLPHIAADEIPLSETLVVEIEQTPGVNLAELLGTPAQ